MQSTEQKLREALQALQAISHIDDSTNHAADASVALDRIGKIARQAHALPTAAPVGERDLPTLPEPHIRNGKALLEQDWTGFTADQMRAYARAAMSAGDAVDAQRYRWLREQSDDDFAFAVVKTPHFDVYESPEELDAAIDAAMRKGQP